MQNFKEYLITENTNIKLAPWHLTSSKQIKEAIQYDGRNHINDFAVYKHSVNVIKSRASFYYDNTLLDKTRLPFHFDTANDLTIRSETLTNIWGAPIIADELEFKLKSIKTLENLRGSYNDLDLYTPSLEEFNCNVKTNHIFINAASKFNAKDFSKSFESDTSLSLNFGASVAEKLLTNTPLLSLLLTKNFNRISHNGIAGNKLTELSIVMDIINYHAKIDRDILECQEELITNGFRQYAKL
jgi:hypothetical protein